MILNQSSFENNEENEYNMANILFKASQVNASKISESYAKEHREQADLHEWLSLKLMQIISYIITSFNSGSSLTLSERESFKTIYLALTQTDKIDPKKIVQLWKSQFEVLGVGENEFYDMNIPTEESPISKRIITKKIYNINAK